MKTAFKKTLIAFLIFILSLIGILIGVIKGWSQSGSLIESMMMVDFTGLLLGVLGASVLILISVALTFWLAHTWSIEQPALGKQIIRLAMLVSILLILVFGGMGNRSNRFTYTLDSELFLTQKEINLMMKILPFRFTLYALIVYLTGSVFNPTVAAPQPSAENGTFCCGVIDGQPQFHQDSKRHSDQFPNRRYAQTFAANLNVGEPYTVRLIYFLPSDRQPQPDIDTKMDRLIKDTQQFYAEMMESHGFSGEKPFGLKPIRTGKAVVHHVNGKFNDAYYYNSGVWEELNQQFDRSNTFYLTALDVSTERIDRFCGRGGRGKHEWDCPHPRIR